MNGTARASSVQLFTVPNINQRPHLLPLTLITLFLVTVRDVSLAFFAAMINAEGTRVYSPIMLFQGAPRSHFVTDHRIALVLAEGIDTLPGRLVSFAAILVVAWFCAVAIQTRVTWRGKLVVSVIAFELTVVAANVLFSAAAAYHHVGWGMDCNWQFVGSLVTANVLVGAIAVAWAAVGAVLWAVVASIQSSGRSRLISA